MPDHSLFYRESGSSYVYKLNCVSKGHVCNRSALFRTKEVQLTSDERLYKIWLLSDFLAYIPVYQDWPISHVTQEVGAVNLWCSVKCAWYRRTIQETSLWHGLWFKHLWRALRSSHILDKGALLQRCQRKRHKWKDIPLLRISNLSNSSGVFWSWMFKKGMYVEKKKTKQNKIRGRWKLVVSR